MKDNSPDVAVKDEEISDLIFETLQQLSDQWGVDVEVTIDDRARSYCYHQYDKGRKVHVLVFGLPCVRSMMKRGPHFTGEYHFRGLNAIMDVSVHEYAHAIVSNLNWRVKGEVHNEDFWGFYHQMVKDVILS